jgi:hypothetical protein
MVMWHLASVQADLVAPWIWWPVYQRRLAPAQAELATLQHGRGNAHAAGEAIALDGLLVDGWMFGSEMGQQMKIMKRGRCLHG